MLSSPNIYIYSPDTEIKCLTNTTKKPPFFIYSIYGKRSCGGSPTWEPRNIWYRVWYCPNCCRMRRIPWYYINHRLPVKSLCTYIIRFYLSYTSTYRSIDFFTHIQQRNGGIFLGWRQQREVLEYTRPQSYNKIQIYDLGEWWVLPGMRDSIHATVESITWNPHY